MTVRKNRLTVNFVISILTMVRVAVIDCMKLAQIETPYIPHVGPFVLILDMHIINLYRWTVSNWLARSKSLSKYLITQECVSQFGKVLADFNTCECRCMNSNWTICHSGAVVTGEGQCPKPLRGTAPNPSGALPQTPSGSLPQTSLVGYTPQTSDPHKSITAILGWLAAVCVTVRESACRLWHAVRRTDHLRS